MSLYPNLPLSQLCKTRNEDGCWKRFFFANIFSGILHGLLKYNRVEDLIERLLEAKHNVQKCVKNFLENVFTQKGLGFRASSDKFSGWTEYDSLILGNLSPRSVQNVTFHEIHVVLLNDLSERTLLWVARVNQELMQTLHTAINTAAFTGFQVLSTRIRGREIISPHFKTLDESILRAAESVINNFFTLHNPYPISRKEKYNRSRSLFIDCVYSNSMNSLFDANFVRVSHEKTIMMMTRTRKTTLAALGSPQSPSTMSTETANPTKIGVSTYTHSLRLKIFTTSPTTKRTG